MYWEVWRERFWVAGTGGSHCVGVWVGVGVGDGVGEFVGVGVGVGVCVRVWV